MKSCEKIKVNKTLLREQGYTNLAKNHDVELIDNQKQKEIADGQMFSLFLTLPQFWNIILYIRRKYKLPFIAYQLNFSPDYFDNKYKLQVTQEDGKTEVIALGVHNTGYMYGLNENDEYLKDVKDSKRRVVEDEYVLNSSSTYMWFEKASIEDPDVYSHIKRDILRQLIKISFKHPDYWVEIMFEYILYGVIIPKYKNYFLAPEINGKKYIKIFIYSLYTLKDIEFIEKIARDLLKDKNHEIEVIRIFRKGSEEIEDKKYRNGQIHHINEKLYFFRKFIRTKRTEFLEEASDKDERMQKIEEVIYGRSREIRITRYKRERDDVDFGFSDYARKVISKLKGKINENFNKEIINF